MSVRIRKLFGFPCAAILVTLAACSSNSGGEAHPRAVAAARARRLIARSSPSPPTATSTTCTASSSRRSRRLGRQARRPAGHLLDVVRWQHHTGPERRERVPRRRRGALARPRRPVDPGRRDSSRTTGRRMPRRASWRPPAVVFDVRPGNPKDITNWSDLTQSGLQILTPDPAQSGGAKWNIVGAYGASMRGNVPGYAKDSQSDARSSSRASSATSP